MTGRVEGGRGSSQVRNLDGERKVQCVCHVCIHSLTNLLLSGRTMIGSLKGHSLFKYRAKGCNYVVKPSFCGEFWVEVEAKRTVKWNWTCIACNEIQFSADFQYKTTVIGVGGT